MSFGIPVRNGLGLGLTPATTLSSGQPGGRPAMFLDFVGTTALDSRVTFTRSTTATFTGSNGLIQTAAINAPRFDYAPATLASKGLLIEEQRTNLLLQSNGFTNSPWASATSGVAVLPILTANAGISPDGTSNATRLQLDCVNASNAANRSRLFQALTVSNSTAYRGSIYVKAYNASNVGKTVRITSDNIGNVVVTLTDSWTRVEWGGTSVATASNIIIECRGVFTTQTADLLIYGAQLEAGTFATSYIPTVAAQVTRTADIATMTGTNFSSWYNQSEGTIVASVDTAASTGSPILSFQDGAGASTNRHQMNVYTTCTATVVGGVDQANLGTNTSASVNLAYAYKTDNFAASANGGTAATDTSGTVPSTLAYATLGKWDYGTAASLNGHIRSISYYTTRLPNTNLQALTS